MVQLRGLVVFTLLLPGVARRSIRSSAAHDFAQQQSSMLSGDARETLIPHGVGSGLSSQSSRVGPGRATVALNAASGSGKDQLFPQTTNNQTKKQVDLSRRIGRRSWLAPFAAAPFLMAAPAYADGTWAQHFGEFSDADFKGMQTTPSGLQYKVVSEGSGGKPYAGQRIKAQYAGYLLNGKKFDASYDRGKPLEFNVGVGNVIRGWDEALLDMKVGEKRLLKIPPELGYGSKGAGGVIPGGATLVFYVELVFLSG